MHTYTYTHDAVYYSIMHMYMYVCMCIYIYIYICIYIYIYIHSSSQLRQSPEARRSRAPEPAERSIMMIHMILLLLLLLLLMIMIMIMIILITIMIIISQSYFNSLIIQMNIMPTNNDNEHDNDRVGAGRTNMLISQTNNLGSRGFDSSRVVTLMGCNFPGPQGGSRRGSVNDSLIRDDPSILFHPFARFRDKTGLSMKVHVRSSGPCQTIDSSAQAKQAKTICMYVCIYIYISLSIYIYIYTLSLPTVGLRIDGSA